MKQKKINLFRQNFLEFIRKYRLLSAEHRPVVAVSGGVDSVVLFDLFLWLKKVGEIDSFAVVTFDHGLRQEAAVEVAWVKQLCQQHGVECWSYQFNLQNVESNIEFIARQKRYNIFNQLVERGHWCYLGHHLNDAYEWYLLQLFKSSAVSLGIPLVRGGIIRPLLGFSKQHLLQYAKLSRLESCNDPSNLDCSFERNYVRNMIIPLIQQRFPQYLKHFAFQMNRRALKINRLRAVNSEQLSYRLHNFGPCGLAILFPMHCRDIAAYRELIWQSIIGQSVAHRGTLVRQLEKLEQAFRNGKKGPICFSGKVEVLIYQHAIYIYPTKLKQKVGLGESQVLMTVDALWSTPFVAICNQAVNKRCLAKRFPAWIKKIADQNHLVSTIELFCQLSYYHRIDENKLINCKFQNIQLF